MCTVCITFSVERIACIKTGEC